MHPNPKRLIPVVLIVAVLGGAAWWYWGGGNPAAPAGALTASGTIEATQIELGPELGGRVVAVNAAEGEAVAAGAALIQLDTTLLDAQRAQAEAAVAVALAALETAQASLAPAQANVAAAEAATAAAEAQSAQLKEGARPEQIAAAEAQVKALNSAVGQAAFARDDAKKGATPDQIAAAEARVAQAEAQRQQLQEAYNRLPDQAQGAPREQAWLQWQAAEQNKQAALAALEQLQAGVSAQRLNSLNSGVGVAVYQRDAAEAQLDLLKAGATAEQLAAAQSQVDAAQARQAAAEAQLGVLQAQIKAAEAQVAAARAAVAVIDAQLQKTTIHAPAAGVVLARSVEVGEFAAPGATLLALGDLDNLNLTVYVPEDRYGEIRLGQATQVTVDSFPGETFAATVAHIADQAEFTPRNVQTGEGRRTTVFAVRLTVDNPAGKLKPGMPADVTFGE
ncbi:MAG: efflux RND transporter periplasmic adaptor subunit [Anaerolineales bacterium]|nr:efflux RND transporter periplasmic adaptor subunit [Anaerolineales bacterium]